MESFRRFVSSVKTGLSSTLSYLLSIRIVDEKVIRELNEEINVQYQTQQKLLKTSRELEQKTKMLVEKYEALVEREAKSEREATLSLDSLIPITPYQVIVDQFYYVAFPASFIEAKSISLELYSEGLIKILEMNKPLFRLLRNSYIVEFDATETGAEPIIWWVNEYGVHIRDIRGMLLSAMIIDQVEKRLSAIVNAFTALPQRESQLEIVSECLLASSISSPAGSHLLREWLPIRSKSIQEKIVSYL